MLDHYVSGEVGRISPEAPVPVVHMQNTWSVPGGAANVARCVARLGGSSFLIGLTGQDQTGEILRSLIRAEGIENGVLPFPDRQSIRKTRIMARGQQLLRLDEEKLQPPAEAEMLLMQARVREYLPRAGAAVLSDYAKGALLAGEGGADICSFVIAGAKAAGIPVLVDPKGTEWSRYRGASCITPNMGEFIKAACALLDDRSLENILRTDGKAREHVARKICEIYDLGAVLLTRGALGMNLYPRDESPVLIRAAAREVADVSGAGDTAIATFAACVACGLQFPEAARIANTAAGVAVGKTGTSPVTPRELRQALREDTDNPKLLALPELAEKLDEWRRHNERIVFTNGCFDLLHPGHVSLLRECAARGDRLVVGLNSDASVKRLKGEERPLQDEQSRATVLAALQAVDAVVIFEDDTPLELIKAVRPDCLVKGEDYTLDNVVGADFVRSYGGKVHLARLKPGFSTTGLVRGIRQTGEK